MIRCAKPLIPGRPAINNGRKIAAPIPNRSNKCDRLSPFSLCKKRAKTPNEKANPITVAVNECSKSSTGSKGTSGRNGLCENAAVANIITPNPMCIQTTARPQVLPALLVSQSTANPNKRKPIRVTQAFSSPCAADSLVVLAIQE